MIGCPRELFYDKRMSVNTTTEIQKALPWKSALALFVITFLAYWPSLSNGFVNFDDDKYVYENPLIRSIAWDNIKAIFTNITDNVYVPLTVLTYAWEHHFVGLKPFVYHFDNIILHGLNTILIFCIARKLRFTDSAAFLGALFFGLHPMRVESVAWVTERKDVLYTLFYLLAMISYFRYSLDKQRTHYFLSLLFCVISMLAKAATLTLPFILLACDWLNKRRLDRNMLLDKIPYFFIIVPIAWITFHRNTIVYSVNTSLVETVLIFIWSITFYPIKFFWPASLYPAYLLPEPISAAQPTYILAFVVFVILIESIILLRRDRLYVWAWLMYLGGIFYLLRFDNVPYINWAADRFMYLPSLGLCLYFGSLLDKGIKNTYTYRRQWAIPILGGILMLYGFLFVKSYRQNFIWKDSITLWSYVISRDPKVSSAYVNRGVIYKAQGKFEEALQDYNTAIDINPLSAESYSNRGNLLLTLKRYDDALTDLNAAVRLNPQLDKSFLNRGNCFYLLKQYDAAEKDFSTSIRLNSRNTSSLNNRGLVYFRQQRFEKALEDFTAALRMDNKYGSAYFNRALTYQKLGRMDEARRDFASAAALGIK